MLMILIALIVAAFCAGVLVNLGSNSFFEFTGLLLCLVVSLAMVVYSLLCWDWISSDYKAEIINREYKTSYTREEVFYAKDVIDTIREIDRKRIEVNGNLLREK